MYEIKLFSGGQKLAASSFIPCALSPETLLDTTIDMVVVVAPDGKEAIAVSYSR